MDTDRLRVSIRCIRSELSMLLPLLFYTVCRPRRSWWEPRLTFWKNNRRSWGAEHLLRPGRSAPLAGHLMRPLGSSSETDLLVKPVRSVPFFMAEVKNNQRSWGAEHLLRPGRSAPVAEHLMRPFGSISKADRSMAEVASMANNLNEDDRNIE